MILLTLLLGLIVGYEIKNSGILRDIRNIIKNKYNEQD